MRTLNFTVDQQTLRPEDDLGGLVKGSQNYYEAKFSLSADWSGMGAVAQFRRVFDPTWTTALLDDGDSCVVPEDIAGADSFEMRVVGQDGDERVFTNRLTIEQGG